MPTDFNDSLFCSPEFYTTSTAPQDFIFTDTVHPTSHLSEIVAREVEKQFASSRLGS